MCVSPPGTQHPGTTPAINSDGQRPLLHLRLTYMQTCDKFSSKTHTGALCWELLKRQRESPLFFLVGLYHVPNQTLRHAAAIQDH